MSCDNDYKDPIERVADLFEDTIINVLTQKLSETGDVFHHPSLLVEVPIFQYFRVNHSSLLRVESILKTVDMILSELYAQTKVPWCYYFSLQHTYTNIFSSIARSLYSELLKTPINSVILEIPGADKITVHWYLTRLYTDKREDKDGDKLLFTVEVRYGIGAIVWTTADLIKKFSGNRLKMMLELNQNHYIYTSIPVKDIIQLVKHE